MSEPKKRRKPGPKPLPEGKKKVTRNIAIRPEVWDEAVDLCEPSLSAVVEAFLVKEIRRIKRRKGIE